MRPFHKIRKDNQRVCVYNMGDATGQRKNRTWEDYQTSHKCGITITPTSKFAQDKITCADVLTIS